MSPESKPTVQTVQSVLKETELKMQKTIEAVSREFAVIRTGRASPALVEGIRVDYYGTPTPLKQLASVSSPDPKLLVVQPWDPNVLPEVEKALLKSDLGFSPVQDGKVLRVPIPPLSTERRVELTKLAHKQAEEGRISIRTIRHSGKETIEKLFKDKGIAEDEKFKGLDSLQKLTDRYHKKVDELLSAKEADLKVV